MALDGQCLSSQCTAMTRRWGVMCAANVTYPGTLFLQQLIWGAAGSFCSSHPAVCLQVCSLGVGVSLCMQGSTCHECVQFVKSPCLKFYGAALPQPHVTAPTRIKCHLNILAAQYKREPIPSQEYHPLRWEWEIRFPYPHLPLSLSASAIEADKGPRLWAEPPPPCRGWQRCSVRTGCATPAPLPTPPGQPFSNRQRCAQPLLPAPALCSLPLWLHGPRMPSRDSAAALPSAGSASSARSCRCPPLPAGLGDPREELLSHPRSGPGRGEGGERGESRAVGGSVLGRQRMADAGSRRVGRLENR